MNLSSMYYIVHSESVCLTGDSLTICKIVVFTVRERQVSQPLWEGLNSILEDKLIYLCFLTVFLGRSEVRVCGLSCKIATTSPYGKKVFVRDG